MAIKKRKKALPFIGYVAYRGPSLIDGKPIVVIVNGFKGSKNAKTGHLIQSFILREDINPVRALKTGDDYSICGNCEHRPKRVKSKRKKGEVKIKSPCYVNVPKSVLSVWKAYKRGRYVEAPLPVIAKALTGLKLRIGTYGDGAMAPVHIWQSLTEFTAGHTGYSHQWAESFFDVQQWAPLVMASVDSVDERHNANALGLRTFRVSIGVDRRKGEATCPASKEAGNKLTCSACMLCGGTSVDAKDIVIADHAIGHQNRIKMVAA